MGAALAWAGAALRLGAAPESPWITATADELSAPHSTLQRDAAAEVLLWRIEVDDRKYPRDRKVTEYRRYKLFAPDKAGQVMRVARTDVMVNGHTMFRHELRARLTQPDGSSRELGRESILERQLSKMRCARCIRTLMTLCGGLSC